MTYEQALAYIHAVDWKGSRPGLGRITQLMHRLGDPQKALAYVHIVGTNGKGSTAAMLSSVLTRAGYTTGLFISPYVICFRERMQINGKMISPTALAQVTAQVAKAAEGMEDAPTAFERITAIALTWFAREGCQIAVMEAGMGGELDATNVIPAPQVGVVTNIGLDHTQYLGHTLAQIAATKAGILKPGCDCVLYPNAPEVERVVAGVCREKKIPLHDPSPVILVRENLTGQQVRWRGKPLTLSLLGAHQRQNAAVALETLRVLQGRGWDIPFSAIAWGLAHTQWPGRLEVLSRSPLVLLDGGHNPQCVSALTRALRDYLPEDRPVLLTGVLADKDYQDMFAPLLPWVSQVFTVTPPNPRALPGADLAKVFAPWRKTVTVCQSIAGGVNAALAAAKATQQPLLVCGSLYLAAEVRNLLLGGEGDGQGRPTA